LEAGEDTGSRIRTALLALRKGGREGRRDRRREVGRKAEMKG